MTRSVALIGYGAIARRILDTLSHGENVQVSRILVRDINRAAIRTKDNRSIEAIDDPEQIGDEIDAVLECAGHAAVRDVVPGLLERGLDVGLLSVGTLADRELLSELTQAAKVGSATLSILAGAIGGIDALAAAGADLSEVTYTSRKPPLSWAGSPAEQIHDLAAISEETAIFSGSARQAALAYPKNANVVATVALAGIGFERTDVTLLADPRATGNTHIISARGPNVRLRFETSSAALQENPRTSALTAQSAVRWLRGRGGGIVI